MCLFARGCRVCLISGAGKAVKLFIHNAVKVFSFSRGKIVVSGVTIEYGDRNKVYEETVNCM